MNVCLVTPPEYQPPGFMEAVENDTLSFMVDNIRIKVGHVQTPYTSMKVRVRASKDQFEAKVMILLTILCSKFVSC